MNRKIQEIRSSMQNKCFLSALALALTLPDICSQVEANVALSSRQLYIDWVDKHINKEYFKTGLSGFEDAEFAGNVCYSLRCSYLHSGALEVENSKLNVHINEFELFIPKSMSKDVRGKPNGFSYKIKTLEDGKKEIKVELNIQLLCEALCDAAEEFYNGFPDKTKFINRSCIIK